MNRRGPIKPITIKMNYNERTYVSGKVLKDSSSDDSAESCIYANPDTQHMRLPDGRYSSPPTPDAGSEANVARQSALDSEYNMSLTDDKKSGHDEREGDMLVNDGNLRQAGHKILDNLIHGDAINAIHVLVDTLGGHGRRQHQNIVKTEQELSATQKTLLDTQKELFAEHQARFKAEAECKELSRKLIEYEQAAKAAEDNAINEWQLRESEHEKVVQDLRQQCDAKDKSLREAAVEQFEAVRKIEWLGQEQRASREEITKLREANHEHEQKAAEEKQERKRLWGVISDRERTLTRFMLKKRKSRAKALKDEQTIVRQEAIVARLKDIISERNRKAAEEHKERERLCGVISDKEQESAQAQQENKTLLKKAEEDKTAIAGLEATLKKREPVLEEFTTWMSSSPQQHIK